MSNSIIDKLMNFIADRLKEYISDSGFENVTLKSGFSHYTNAPLQCRKIGKVVFVQGVVIRNTSLPAAWTTIGTISYTPKTTIFNNSTNIWSHITAGSHEIKSKPEVSIAANNAIDINLIFTID